jgi:hypothetical protein
MATLSTPSTTWALYSGTKGNMARHSNGTSEPSMVQRSRSERPPRHSKPPSTAWALFSSTKGNTAKHSNGYQRALDGYEKTLGKDHPSTLNTINNMSVGFREPRGVWQGTRMVPASPLWLRQSNSERTTLRPAELLETWRQYAIVNMSLGRLNDRVMTSLINDPDQ